MQSTGPRNSEYPTKMNPMIQVTWTRTCEAQRVGDFGVKDLAGNLLSTETAQLKLNSSPGDRA